MRKLVALAVLAAAVLLAGCDLMDIINDLVGGGTGDPGGGAGIGGVTFTRIIVEYSIDMDVNRIDTGIELRNVFASIGSIGALAFDQGTTTYVAQNAIGSDPYVLITITLDQAGANILYLDAYRRMSHGLGSWERIDRIIVEDIPYDRVEGNSTFYRVDASNTSATTWFGLSHVDYRDWSKALHTEQAPMYWVADPDAAQGFFNNDPDRYIEIEFQQ